MTTDRCASKSQWGNPRGLPGWIVCQVMAAKNTGMNMAVIRRLAPRSGERLLEVGGGPGESLQKLLNMVGEDGFVAEQDHSEIAVALARRRNAAAIEEGRADVRQGGISRMLWPENSFDGALAINNFHFWPDPVEDMRKLLRVLKPGGRAVIGIRGAARPLRFEFAGAERGHARADAARKAMELAGFRNIEVQTDSVGRLLALSVIGHKAL